MEMLLPKFILWHFVRLVLTALPEIYRTPYNFQITLTTVCLSTLKISTNIFVK